MFWKNCFYLIFLFLFFQCKSEKKEIIPTLQKGTGIVNISGKLNNQPDRQVEGIVRIGINDLATNQQEIYKSTVTENQFEINFSLDHTQDFVFYYGNELVTLIASPGDTIVLLLDHDSFQDEQNDDFKLSFERDDAAVNNDLQELLKIYENKFPKVQHIEKRKNSTLQDYTAFRLDLMQQQLGFWEQFKQSKPEKPAYAFQKWMENNIKYTAGKDVLSKAIFNETDSLDVYVNRILEKIPLNEPYAVSTSAYNYFIQYYQMYLLADNGLDHKHPEGKVLEMQPEIDKIRNAMDGQARNIALSKYYYHHIGAGTAVFPENLMENYDTLVTDSFYKRKIQEKYRVLYGNGTIILQNNIVINKVVNNNVDKLLPYLIKRHENKVIYIDIWATWCQPCLKEMAIYPEFRQQFPDNDIQFVFLAADSRPNQWYKKIKDLKLRGEHYLLSAAQYLQLQNQLYIDGIPHYVLINKKGQIVDDMAPHPSTGEGKFVNKALVDIIKNLN